MIHGPHSFKQHDGFGRFVIISLVILCQSHNAAFSLSTAKVLKRSYCGFFKNLNVQIPRTRWYRILKSITIRSPSCISPSPSSLSFENQPTVGIGKSKLSKNIERGKLESWSERCTATDTHKIILLCGHAWGWSLAWFMSWFTCTPPPLL